MESQIDLTSEIKHIENFKTLLEKYKDFKSCLRDIKISTVLGQKCLFEIEDIDPPLVCYLSDNILQSLNQSAILISKLSFKIDTDLSIIELNITYKILDTKMGKLIFELQNLEIPIPIKPKVVNSQVFGFYIDNQKLSTNIFS